MSPFGYVGPPPGGLEAAMSTARQRRFRSAGLTTSVMASALTVLALVAGGSGSATLLQEPAPQLPANSPVLHGEARSTTSPAPNVSGPRAQVPGAIDPARTASSGATSRPSPRPAPAGVEGKGYAAGPLTTQHNVFGPAPTPNCTITGKTEDATNLCPSTYVDTYNPGSLVLTARVCSTRTDTTVLHYAMRNEVDLSIWQAGEELWRWSDWHRNAGPAHVQRLATGACEMWSFNWTMVDRTGKSLPPGTYLLKTTFLAQELQGRRLASASFTIN